MGPTGGLRTMNSPWISDFCDTTAFHADGFRGPPPPSSPVGLPLAGFLRRAQRGLPCGVQDDPLEINAAAFRDGDQAALLIAIDTLIAGPDLTAAADALAQECFGPGAVALVAASHTHFAPATDRTRPMLGEIAPAYVAAVHDALRQVVVELRVAQTGPSVGLASCVASANVHRRRRWPFRHFSGGSIGASIALSWRLTRRGRAIR